MGNQQCHTYMTRIANVLKTQLQMLLILVYIENYDPTF